MGISLEEMDYAGCYEARITGLESVGDHAALFAHVGELIRDARIAALLIDAREAELPGRPSLSRDVWEDGIAVLHVIPLGYMPPPGGGDERWAMIRATLAEWEAEMTFLDSREAALDWCRCHAWPAGGPPA